MNSISIQLQLRRAQKPGREAAAWFLPGNECEGWLEEICRWQIPQGPMRLYPVAALTPNQGLLGVLVVPGPGQPPKVFPRAIAFARLAEGVYVPTDGELYPPVQLEELEALSIYDTLIFHPQAGLVGIDSEEALRVVDLLDRPSRRDENWNAAHPGVALNDRLISVQLALPDTFEGLFGEESSDIGQAPPTQLPPAPQEPGPARQMSQKLGRGLAQSLSSLLRSLGTAGAKPSWLDRIERWTSEQVRRLTAQLEMARQKELNRLLNLLENDPDEGLRYALPMNQVPGCGLARPSGKLGSKDPHFNLKQLRGGGPVDHWQISDQYHLLLRQKYLELANREMKLGRFRRAAYIFAHLLGDLNAAASTLKQGRHFQEAAVLYRDHLRLPRVAAECLAAGGLIAEAVAIYEAEGAFLEAGRVYAQAGMTAEAGEAYRKAAAKLVSAGDLLGGAGILKEEGQAPLEALAVLRQGWPHSRQAFQCLAEEFNLLGQLGAHSQSTERLLDLQGETTALSHIPPLAKLLAGVNAQYPDRAVRAQAANLAQVKASLHLARPELTGRRELVQIICGLASQDRLLERDGGRFLALDTKRARARPSPAKIEPKGLTVLCSFQLPPAIAWQNVRATSSHFFALGRRLSRSQHAETYVLVRGVWEGMNQMMEWEQPPPEASPPGVAMEILNGEAVYLAARQVDFWPQEFPAADLFFPKSVAVSSPAWLPKDTLGLARGPGENIWVLRETPLGCQLSCWMKDGILVSTMEVPELNATVASSESPVVMLHNGDCVAIGMGNVLLIYWAGIKARTFRLESAITGLTAVGSRQEMAIAISLENGLAAYWVETGAVQIVGPSMLRPIVASLGHDTVVVGSDRDVWIFGLHQHSFVQRLHTNWRGLTPLALTQGSRPQEFAAFQENGFVQIFGFAAVGE